MDIKKAKRFQKARIITQIVITTLFFFLFLDLKIIGFDNIEYASLFFYLDPLILISNYLATGKILSVLLFSLIPFFLTLILGRFFCGWVCPMGALNQFFSWIFRKSNKRKLINKQGLRIKYYVLIILLISTLLGANFVGWLDPFSILTRSMSTITPATENLLLKTVTNEKVYKQTAFQEFIKEEIVSDDMRTSSQPFLIGGLFIVLLLMNYYHRRFFCNVLCPLGAIYGLLARVGFLKLTTNTSCNSCKACSKECTYNGNPDDAFIKSECMLCFNCMTDCPTTSIEISIKPLKKVQQTQVDLGRRRILGSLAAGIALASLPGAALLAKPKAKHSFLRPPGAIKEEDFIDQCMRCGQCIQSCPTGFIQPSLLEGGIAGLWTPIVNAQAGSCNWECNECTSVCPTNALEKLTLKQKQQFKIGTAIIDKNRCYTYADGINCTLCYDACPTPEKAILYRKVDVWNYQGKKVNINQIYIDPELCTGCGICENICPRHDAAGIIISADDEIRDLII